MEKCASCKAGVDVSAVLCVHDGEKSHSVG